MTGGAPAGSKSPENGGSRHTAPSPGLVALLALGLMAGLGFGGLGVSRILGEMPDGDVDRWIRIVAIGTNLTLLNGGMLLNQFGRRRAGLVVLLLAFASIAWSMTVIQ